MSIQEEKEFIEQAFKKLRERGWFSKQELEPSTITEQEIAAFEEEHQVTLPSLYKAFLTSYYLPESDCNEICAIVDDMGDISPLWLMIDSPRNMEQISEAMENLQIIRDFCELPEDCFKNLVPIGDWGAGWGPLCIDCSKPEEKVDEEDESTWSLVWFDHEEFEWDEIYLGNDGLLHGREAAPSFKVLLDWYFCGALEAEYEEEEGVKPTYEWYYNTLNE